VLDVEDPIRAAYTLEVSSPGVDRPFFFAQQLADYIDEEITLTLARPVAERRKFTGRLISVEGEMLGLEVEGETLEVEFSNVMKARLKPDWSSLT